MGAEIDESSMTTGAVADNTGCVGRRAGRGVEASDSENLPVQPGAVRD